MTRDLASAHRHLILLRTLHARRLGVSVRAMARELEVSEKTVRRDLDLLRAVGLPIEEEVGEFGRKQFKLGGSTQAPPIGFSYDEAIAIYFARRLLEPLAGTPFWEASQSAFQKIRAALGHQALAHFEEFRRLIHHTSVGASDYARKDEVVDALQMAVMERKAVYLVYQSDRATEPAARDVYPYGFVFHSRSLYLVAFAPQDEMVKTYKVDRIECVEVTNFPFQRPDDFDLDAYLSRSFGIYHGDGDIRVKVRFAPSVARYVLEGRWHPGQVLTRQRDGSLLAEFRLCAVEELKSWVLSFGRKAVVLEPESLRREIAEELEALAAAYAAPLEEPAAERIRHKPRNPVDKGSSRAKDNGRGVRPSYKEGNRDADH